MNGVIVNARKMKKYQISKYILIKLCGVAQIIFMVFHKLLMIPRQRRSSCNSCRVYGSNVSRKKSVFALASSEINICFFSHFLVSFVIIINQQFRFLRFKNKSQSFFICKCKKFIDILIYTQNILLFLIQFNFFSSSYYQKKNILFYYYYQATMPSSELIKFLKALPKFIINLKNNQNIISHMLSKAQKIFGISLIIGFISLILLSQFHIKYSENLQIEGTPNSLDVNIKGVSSILRSNLSSVFILNDTIYAGQNVGSIAIWTYDSKKKKLQFQDISRQASPSLPPANKVVHLQALAGEVVTLTSDGKLTVYAVNSASKITGKSQITLEEKQSWFTLIKINITPNQTQHAELPTIIAAIDDKKKQLCLYQVNESLIRPNPIIKIVCNQTSTNLTYQHVSYDPMNNLISVGDQTKVVLFQLNVTESKPTLKYLAEANLPKVQVKGFKSIFANGTLLTITDLWLCSYAVDVSGGILRVISAERTQRIVKQGLSTDISAVFDAKLKKSIVMINSKDRVQAFTLVNNKLTYVNDSKIVGSCQNFALKDETTAVALVGQQIFLLKLGEQMDKDYLTIQDEQTISSSNHLKRVKSMSLYNNSIFVSASEGGKYNLKLWNYSNKDYTLKFVDQKTVTFFSILKSGYLNFLTTMFIPAPAKSTTVHVAAGGADPFGLYIVPINSQGKFGSVFRSKDQHTNNITSILLSADHKSIITTSMDSTVKIWTLTNNHDQVQDNTTTVSLKNGPIRIGLADKTGTYYVFAHNNNIFNHLVNITLWKTDSKHGLVHIAQNVINQGHETNITKMILSKDEKYIISYSLSGELKLWRHENWTMIDLMGSLGLGIFDETIQTTDSNKLLIQSEKYFAEYYYDSNGFILLGRSSKTLPTVANSSLIQGNTWFSGEEDGSIRVYTFTQ